MVFTLDLWISEQVLHAFQGVSSPGSGPKRHMEEPEHRINGAPEPKLKAHATSVSRGKQERDTPYTQPLDKSDHDGPNFENYAGSSSRVGKCAELEAVVKAHLPNTVNLSRPEAAIPDGQLEAAISNGQPEVVILDGQPEAAIPDKWIVSSPIRERRIPKRWTEAENRRTCRIKWRVLAICGGACLAAWWFPPWRT